MSRETRDFAGGTFLLVEYPWGWTYGGAAMCSDGKVRRLVRIAQTADTFFSIPAAVRVRGRTVAGYVTVESCEGFQTTTDVDPAILKFVAITYGKNHELLPVGSWKGKLT